MAFWSVAAPIIGGALSYLGGREQSKAAGSAAGQAQAVRDAIMKIFSPQGYADMAKLFAPGLFGGGGYATPTYDPTKGWTMPTISGTGVEGKLATYSPGAMYMGWLMNQLANPGKMLPTTYTRAQEQVEAGRAASSRALQNLGGTKGISGSSPAMLALQSAINLSAGKQKSEAARDYGLAQEQLYRSDLNQAMANYMQLFSAIQNAQAQKAGAIGGVAIPQVAAVNPYEGITNFLGSLLSSGYFGGKKGP